MVWFLVILVIVVILVYKMKSNNETIECPCQNCGKPVGKEPQVFISSASFCMCKECTNKIHPQILDYAKKSWTYTDYTDYLAWEEATREERAQFNPDAEYGAACKLKVDTERGLFCLDSMEKGGLVFRFTDLNDYELSFKPEELKEGFLGDKVIGSEFATVELTSPNVYLEEILVYGVKLEANKKGILSSKYEYELRDEFMEIIRAFSLCIYIELARRDGEYQEETMNIGEVQKALALFMFDSMDEVTHDGLKKQRNALIKAFHPDNAEENETYSQKINAAYDILSGLAKS